MILVTMLLSEGIICLYYTRNDRGKGVCVSVWGIAISRARISNSKFLFCNLLLVGESDQNTIKMQHEFPKLTPYAIFYSIRKLYQYLLIQFKAH